MRGSQFSQMVNFLSVIILLSVHVMATSSVFSSEMYEKVFAGFKNFFVIPVPALIAIEYTVILGLFMTACSQLSPMYNYREGSAWLRVASGPCIIASTLIWVYIILMCYREFITGACILFVVAYGDMTVLYFIFIRKNTHVDLVERYLWQESYGGWHVFTEYMFFLTLSVSLEESNVEFSREPWWFILWGSAITVLNTVLYGVISRRAFPMSVFSSIMILLAVQGMGRSVPVGVLSIVFSVVPILTLGLTGIKK